MNELLHRYFQGFYLDFKNTVLSPLPNAPPIYYSSSNFEEPPMFSTPVGNPVYVET